MIVVVSSEQQGPARVAGLNDVQVDDVICQGTNYPHGCFPYTCDPHVKLVRSQSFKVRSHVIVKGPRKLYAAHIRIEYVRVLLEGEPLQ
jgi:hypothetical protein